VCWGESLRASWFGAGSLGVQNISAGVEQLSGEGLIVCFGDLKFYGALGVVWFYQGFVHDIPDLSNDISSNVLDLGSYLLIQ
jgi:hypothetical protein